MIDKKYRTQKQKLFEDSANRTPHYGIRKFTVGAASVLLSTTLWMGVNAGAVHADTVDGSATTEQVNTADQSGASTAETQAPVATTESQAGTSSAQAGAETATQAPVAITESQTTTSSAAASAEQETESTANTNTASTDTNTASADTVANTASQAENATSTATVAEAVNDQAAAASSSEEAIASSAEVNAPAESQKTDSNSSETAESQAANQSVASEQANAAENTADKQNTEEASNTVTLNVKDALKTSAVAKLSKKMAMVSLASTKLADQYEAKGAEYTEIYGQTIDPKSLISNFSELPTGTTASADNLDAIKTKQGRNVVPVTVTYSDGSTDMANAIVWVTSQGTTALAKKVDLEFNPDTNKSEINTDVQSSVPLPIYYKGTAVISADSVKKGAKIYLANLAQKYYEGLGSGGTSNVNVIDSDGDVIGLLERDTQYPSKLTELRLLVTTDKQYSSDLTIKFNITDDPAYNVDSAMLNYRSAYITNVPEGVEAYDYSGTIVQKRWLHEIGHDDIEYTINRTVGELKASEVMGIAYQVPAISGDYGYIRLPTALGGYTSSSVTASFGDASKAALANNILKEAWALENCCRFWKSRMHCFNGEELARIVAAQVLPKVDWVTSWANLVISAGLLLMLAGIGLIVLGRKGPGGL